MNSKLILFVLCGGLGSGAIYSHQHWPAVRAIFLTEPQAHDGIYYARDRVSQFSANGVASILPGDEVRLVYQKTESLWVVMKDEFYFTLRADQLTQGQWEREALLAKRDDFAPAATLSSANSPNKTSPLSSQQISQLEQRIEQMQATRLRTEQEFNQLSQQAGTHATQPIRARLLNLQSTLSAYDRQLDQYEKRLRQMRAQ